MKARNDDNAPLKTVTADRNCPPVARLDAAATKPNEPIAIDVLANDTDPDGDILVFQIGDVEGGTGAIDDGGTPTDASDDRLLFTPDNPAPLTATIEYDVLDPSGATDTSKVDISVNESATLPDGVRSALATDPPLGTQSEDCGGSTTTTVDDSLTAAGVTTVESSDDESTDTTRRGRTTTTRQGSKSATTTTTTKKTTTTGNSDFGPSPTSPSTTKKPTTTTTPGPTTSHTTPTTQPRPERPNCGPQPEYGTPEFDPWVDCMNNP